MASDQRGKAKATMKACGYKDGGAVAKMAAGGVAKQRLGEANKAGAPLNKPRHFAAGGGVAMSIRKSPTSPPGTAKVKSRGKVGQKGG